jgi:prophage antirepressor-like protein
LNELKIFNNEEFGEIRTVEIDGKPYFVANDVAKALGYVETAKAVRTHCKGVSEMDIPTNGGIQRMKIIPEGDIYRLIIRSQLPAAEKFEKWVFDDVIPTIRQTGGYHLPQTYAQALRALADQAEEMERLALENKEMQPKAEYFDALVERNLLTNFRDTAKELGIKPKKFIAFLMDHRYIYRDYYGNIKPYSQKNDGLFELKEFNSNSSDYSGVQTLITPRGRETFRLLISN